MQQAAYFMFHGALNDFLPPAKREQPILHAFNHHPSVKDVIEALGVPHPEVNVILVNGQSVPFSYLLQNNDRVEVFPLTASTLFPQTHALIPARAESKKFIVDVQAGKLAKDLRILGFDTLYKNDYTPEELVRIAVAENRVVLTRNVGLLKNKAITTGYWLRSQHAKEQVKEVVTYFDLFHQLKPFDRCLVCNGHLKKVAKEKVLDQLPPNTIIFFQEFFQCSQCKRVYWQGSHYERMQQFVREYMHR